MRVARGWRQGPEMDEKSGQGIRDGEEESGGGAGEKCEYVFKMIE